MPRRPLLPLVDMALGGTLEERLRRFRHAGTSYEDIAAELRNDGVVVSGETVRRWCLELGVDEAA